MIAASRMAEIWKYGWAGMKDKWPVRLQGRQAYQIDTEELNKLSGEVDLNGKSIDRSRPHGSPPMKRSGKPGRNRTQGRISSALPSPLRGGSARRAGWGSGGCLRNLL